MSPVRQQKTIRVLHVCESLIGGPASYLDEILPFQVQQLSSKEVILLAPEEHRAHVALSTQCVVETYSRSGRNLRSLLALAVAVQSAVKRHQPDIVHLHGSFAGLVGRLVLKGARSPARIVYCAHCWSFDRPRRSVGTRLYTMIERGLSHLTDVIVNISAHELELLRRARFASKKSVLIVSGLRDLPRERRTSAVSSRPQGAPMRLLFAGRMDRQKGIDLLLGEFAKINRERASLTIIGKAVVDGTPVVLPPHVECLGWVPRDVLPAALDQFDAVIMPSRWEGMPLWAIEVMRSGKVLVCSSHGAFPHFIQHGVNGFLIDVNRPGFLDDALRNLEASDLSAVGRAARATYEKMFGSGPMNADLMELYEWLVTRRAATSEPASASPQLVFRARSSRTGASAA